MKNYWTLKFFNALIVSLSIIFFYFFVKVFTNSSKKALFSTFALFAVPAFLSHFIWAIAITMPLFFVSFYAVEKIKDDKKWWIIAAVVIASTLTASPTHSTYFGLFLVLYIITKIILERKLLLYHIFAGLFGVLLSFVLWWLPMTIKYGFLGTLISLGVIESMGAELIVGGAGTGDRVYNFADFFIAQGQNMINNPIGIGKILSIFVFISLLLIFYHFFILSREVKGKSKAKSYFVTGFLALAVILFVIGTFLFINSNSFNPRAPEEAKLLAEHIKLTLPFIFSSFILLIGLASLFPKYIKENNRWLIISLVWLLLTVYAVNASPYPYKISPFRAWILLAIPVSLLSGEAINLTNNFVKSFAKSFTKSNIAITGISLVVLGLVGYGIVMTSFAQKYAVNTSPTWPPGGFWTSNEEIQGYIWFKDNIPLGTKVFTFSNNALILGFDKFICHWCDDVRNYQKNGFNQTADENYNWLKKEQYEYIIIDGQAARIFGPNETNNKIQGFISSNKFKPVFNNNGMLMFEVI